MRNKRVSVPVLAAIVVVFGVSGAWLLTGSHAATPVASVEAENGLASTTASIVGDSTASGRSAIKFGSGGGGGSNCIPNSSVTAGFPNNCTTGVPAGTTLTGYAGSSTISAATTIDSKTINDELVYTGSGTLTITKSLMNGGVQNQGTGTVVLTDDEVVGASGSSTNANSETDSLIFGSDIHATRLNVHGGKANFQCQDSGCIITDSYFHDPWETGAYHYDVIGSNGVNGMDLEHNTLQCQFAGSSNVTGAAGCSADLGFFGDFAVIENVTVNNNLFMASSDPGYCVITNASKPGKAYPTGNNLVWTNNVFQKGSNGKCGFYGAVDNWVGGNGNVWTGNKWDDGTALNE